MVKVVSTTLITGCILDTLDNSHRRRDLGDWMNRKRAALYLLNRMPLFALIVVLIAVPVALLVSPPSDVVKAEGTTGFKIKLTFHEGSIYIPVQISGKNISGSFTKTTPINQPPDHVDQKGSFRGILCESRIVSSLTF